MNDNDLVMCDIARAHYDRLSGKTDIVNALYNYSQLHQPVGIMKDLCDALEVDGGYRFIDDAFRLTSFKAKITQYELRVRLKLNMLTTLADKEWRTAFNWAVRAHKNSRVGFEYFAWQKFRVDVEYAHITKQDLLVLIQELNRGPSTAQRLPSYIDYLHYRIGHMPYFFSTETKRLYKEALYTRAHVCERKTR